MSEQDLILGAAAGAVLLALCAMFWLVDQRRRSDRRITALQGRIRDLEVAAEAAQASVEAFDSALLAVEDGRASLTSGEDSLVACAQAMGVSSNEPQAVVSAIMRADPDHARRLLALFERGDCLLYTSDAADE